jgi:hypothetical protein
MGTTDWEEDITRVTTKTPATAANDKYEGVSPEQAANRAVETAFDKHKKLLERELKKLVK